MAVPRLFLLFTAFLLTGCQSLKPALSLRESRNYEQAVPKWLEHLPSSTPDVLYGVAEGVTAKDALNHALAEIAATLEVEISSSFTSESSVREGANETLSRSYSEKVTAKVTPLKITNYELLESKKLGFKRYGALVKVNKRSLAAAMLKTLRQSFTEVDMAKKAFLNRPTPQRFLVYTKEIEKLKKSYVEYLPVVALLRRDFDEQKYKNQFFSSLREYDALAKQVTLWVTSEYAPLAEVLHSALQKSSFVLKKRASKFHFVIKIETRMHLSKAYGFYIVRAETLLTTYNRAKESLASQNFELIGRSSQSFAGAKFSLLKALRERIQEDGIENVLGW